MEVEFTQEELLQFGDLVKDITGMNFDECKWLSLKISLKERMNICRIAQPGKYLTLVRTDAKERDELVSLFSVPETYLFRDRVQFDVLRDKILPEMVEKKSKFMYGKPLIKIVSAGCSTGEEPYSLAIAVLQSGLMERCEFHIIGFDINKNALAQARTAEYTRHSFREKDTEFLAGYFSSKGNRYVLREEVKKMVKFYQAGLFNLGDLDFLIDNADIIFFRNVSIYFDQTGVLKALKIMEDKLADDGYLFLGASESLFGRDTGLEMERINGAYVCRHKGKTAQKKEPLNPVGFLAKDMLIPTEKPQTARPAMPEMMLPKEAEPQETHYENALGYLAIKRLDKAEEEFLEQFRITPKHAKSLVGLAQIYADTGRDELAISTCKKAIEGDNLSTESYFILGLVHFKRGEYEEAFSHFKKTIYCDENHFLAQYYLGMTYKAMHKHENARKQYQITVNVIQSLGEEGLRREIAGLSGSYVMSLCMDYISSGAA